MALALVPASVLLKCSLSLSLCRPAAAVLPWATTAAARNRVSLALLPCHTARRRMHIRFQAHWSPYNSGLLAGEALVRVELWAQLL